MNNKLVYLLDYRSSFQEQLQRRLIRNGFSVFTTSRAREAHVLLLDNPFIPDVILLDFKMAQVYNFSLFDSVKIRSRTKTIDVYLLIDSLEEKAISLERRLNAKDFILKSEDTISSTLLLLQESESNTPYL